MTARTPLDEALFTDLYELTMLQSYFDEGMTGTAVFDLFVRRLPATRNYLLACGLDDVLAYLEDFAFSSKALAYLDSLGMFSAAFLQQLEALRFTGDVYAVPEGTVVFAGEPLLEVVAPLPEAQLIETFVLNQVHFQTLVASKGARVVSAAAGRGVVDFGSRRAHGLDAGLEAARALYIAGFGGTSNVLAGQRYGIPLAGTMAHSFVQAHGDDEAAFRAFVRSHRGTTLLVDTYDTHGGIEAVRRLARKLGDEFDVRAIRLDSGDLRTLAGEARRVLDAAGLERVGILASGGLDEWSVAELVAGGAPIDGFGVGTHVVVSADAPSLDAVYKLVEFEGQGTLKLSHEKETLPGRKQVFRLGGDEFERDVIARHDEVVEGAPLLVPVMRAGRRLPGAAGDLEAARSRVAAQHRRLPSALRELAPAAAYPVLVSERLRGEYERLRALHSS